ncbi:MAG: ABC transporter substrate-binding protein [Chloroflexota bacterium]
MRIVSLLPAATEIVFALGLGEELVGRSHACDFPPEALDVPVMTAPAGSRARLDREALAAADPDLILTQDLCEACALTVREVHEVARELPGEVEVVSLEASTVEGILNTISTVGAFAEAEDEAVGLLELLRERLGAVENRVLERRLAGIAPPRVVLLEWLDPPFAAGHWVPEMVRRAGGWELLGSEGARSAETTWERVREVDPELLILAPCGLDAVAAAEAYAVAQLPAWFNELRAVRDGGLFAVDGNGLFSRPGPRVIEGIALLAELFDPEGLAGFAPPTAWVPLSARPVGRA